jgi:glycosyltransferase involved in cell wall biosynthesis
VPFVSVVAGCYNEEGNVAELHRRVVDVFEKELPGYTFELILIDNASEDRTVDVLREIARGDKRLKVIVNNRNFGHIRSPYYGVLQASGDAVIGMASDLEEPPELIPLFIQKWEEGYKIALGQKSSGDEFGLFYLIRKVYYALITRLSDAPLVKNATGFGIYDREVVENLRAINDPYPYFRGLICDLGYKGYHEEQFLYAVRQRDARDHEPFESSASTGDLFRFRHWRAEFPRGAGLSCLQAGVLEIFPGWHGACRNRNILSGGHSIIFRWHCRGVHRFHSYSGDAPAAGH